jgi:hypothetical protein
MPNALSPDRLSAAERLDEIAEILAAGLTRLWQHKSSALSAARGDSCLDFPPDQRRHANPSGTKA